MGFKMAAAKVRFWFEVLGLNTNMEKATKEEKRLTKSCSGLDKREQYAAVERSRLSSSCRQVVDHKLSLSRLFVWERLTDSAVKTNAATIVLNLEYCLGRSRFSRGRRKLRLLTGPTGLTQDFPTNCPRQSLFVQGTFYTRTFHGKWLSI